MSGYQLPTTCKHERCRLTGNTTQGMTPQFALNEWLLDHATRAGIKGKVLSTNW